MWYVVFDMDGGPDGKRPKLVTEVCIDEEGVRHGGKGEIAAFTVQ